MGSFLPKGDWEEGTGAVECFLVSHMNIVTGAGLPSRRSHGSYRRIIRVARMTRQQHCRMAGKQAHKTS
ncbi:unnamed protein product [Ectocarpus sp. CCAP 1310/34]|nr:unnamed protein product [Ectocarpus sp. CCAP 1310/34]